MVKLVGIQAKVISTILAYRDQLSENQTPRTSKNLLTLTSKDCKDHQFPLVWRIQVLSITKKSHHELSKEKLESAQSYHSNKSEPKT